MQAQTLRTFSAPQASGRRAAGAGFVIALHVGLVLALVYGLKVSFLPAEHIIPFTTTVVPDKPIVDDELPVQQPKGTDTTVEVTEPQWTDESSQPQPGQNGGINVAYGNPPGSGPRSIASTHTIPDYPIISIKLNEEGIVSLRLAISETGAVSDAKVLRSSGYDRLDSAAVAWVKAHWRYQPAMRNGSPVPSFAEAQVKFELKGRR